MDQVLSTQLRARASKRCSDFLIGECSAELGSRLRSRIKSRVMIDDSYGRIGDILCSYIVCSNVLIISLSMPSYHPYLSLFLTCV